jgi:hypothetical protein
MPIVFPIKTELVAYTTSYLHGVLSVHGGDGTAGLGCTGVGGELGGGMRVLVTSWTCGAGPLRAAEVAIVLRGGDRVKRRHCKHSALRLTWADGLLVGVLVRRFVVLACR